MEQNAAAYAIKFAPEMARRIQQLNKYLERDNTGPYIIGDQRPVGINIISVNIMESVYDGTNKLYVAFLEKYSASHEIADDFGYFLWAQYEVHGTNYQNDPSDVKLEENELHYVKISYCSSRGLRTHQKMEDAERCLEDYSYLVKRCVFESGGYLIESLRTVTVVQRDGYGEQTRYTVEAVICNNYDPDGNPKTTRTVLLHNFLKEHLARLVGDHCTQ